MSKGSETNTPPTPEDIKHIKLIAGGNIYTWIPGKQLKVKQGFSHEHAATLYKHAIWTALSKQNYVTAVELMRLAIPAEIGHQNQDERDTHTLLMTTSEHEIAQNPQLFLAICELFQSTVLSDATSPYSMRVANGEVGVMITDQTVLSRLQSQRTADGKQCLFNSFLLMMLMKNGELERLQTWAQVNPGSLRDAIQHTEKLKKLNYCPIEAYLDYKAIGRRLHLKHAKLKKILPIELAMAYGHVDICQWLHENATDLGIKPSSCLTTSVFSGAGIDYIHQSTSLHLACLHNNPDVTNTALTLGRKPSFDELLTAIKSMIQGNDLTFFTYLQQLECLDGPSLWNVLQLSIDAPHHDPRYTVMQEAYDNDSLFSSDFDYELLINGKKPDNFINWMQRNNRPEMLDTVLTYTGAMPEEERIQLVAGCYRLQSNSVTPNISAMEQFIATLIVEAAETADAGIDAVEQSVEAFTEEDQDSPERRPIRPSMSPTYGTF